jgi:N-acetylneuraminate synthase
MKNVQIGSYLVGPGHPCFITAEIGINHNGDVAIAKKLIDKAKEAGCQAVKFQKRTIDVVYTAEELAKPRESPFGTTTGDQKRGLEFGQKQYAEIAAYCAEKGIVWFGTPWDEGSADFLAQFDLPCWKIASASLTDSGLLRYVRQKANGKPIILSTGGSSQEQVDRAVDVLGKENLVVLHCRATYPAKDSELNLKCIHTLQDRYDVPIGYSGHEVGLHTTLAAVVLGACMVERHITLDRSMYGSDQAASVEPGGFERLIKDIRVFESALGDGVVRCYDSEIPVMKKLRRKLE